MTRLLWAILLGASVALSALFLSYLVPQAHAAGAPPAAQVLPQARRGEPCFVQSARLLGPGGNQDWSWTKDRLAYDTTDSAGIHQLWTSTPDGKDTRCLSCTVGNGRSRTDRHVVNPTWGAGPSADWIIVQVENDWHPLVWDRGPVTAELVINGTGSELYAVSSDGGQWVRLTNSQWPAVWGHMAPHVSADGTRVLWSQMVDPAGGNAPWGAWRLMLADLALTADKTPALTNVRDISPAPPSAGPLFIEAHGFAPDGKSVLYTSNTGNADQNNMDIWRMDLSPTAKAPTRLVADGNWDEHATYTPDGKHLVYMAGELGIWSMSADLMLATNSGTKKQRLTAFNWWGQPGNTGELTMVARPTFNKDGTKLAVTEQLAAGYPGRRRLWVLSFAGKCGT